MATVKFYRGLAAGYNQTTHKDGIYFATDTKVIYLNGDIYGFNAELNKLVEDITYADGIFTIKYTDATEDQVVDLSPLFLYKSAMPDDLTVPEKIGGLAAGVKASDLKKKTISQVLDDIIFPELQPNVVAPSASIAFKGGFTNNGIYEVGAPAPTADDNFTTGFNRGTCTVAGQPNKNRAGALISDAKTFIYYGNNVATTTLPAKITLNTMQYNYQAHYGQGDELVTSKGNKASVTPNPLPAGTVKSGAVQIFGTYPYFCNGASASSSATDTNFPSAFTPDTKLPLQKYTDTLVGAKFASEAALDTRITFDFPSTKNVTKVEFMNTVSGKWEAFANYSITDLGNKSIQGVDVAYKRLTVTGNKNGAIQLRFTLA